jgi:hypothetical protein
VFALHWQIFCFSICAFGSQNKTRVEKPGLHSNPGCDVTQKPSSDVIVGHFACDLLGHTKRVFVFRFQLLRLKHIGDTHAHSHHTHTHATHTKHTHTTHTHTPHTHTPRTHTHTTHTIKFGEFMPTASYKTCLFPDST